ncbi:polymerase [Anaerocolumna cellulosilytica]|uniref:Polymerase n=1 Tax=Anaerocolumna cellulosilytica TaxID=433286 RepID=A0A6S6QWD3_9FIRM|nr:O-antigen ligase family protein [Anaerocolumna cellulosilytica]MBB5194425.1 hypothetical protein [Anaerocolumna cellulosilytica]BCJ93369.1 polymerase [Anaerocolumna cellulosilytica]
MKGTITSSTLRQTGGNNRLESSGSNKIFLLPLVFISAILPFIMRSYQFSTNLGQFAWFAEDDTKVDIFLFYKQVFLLIACTVMLVCLIYKIVKEKITLSVIPALIPVFLYGIMALLSTLFSKYSSFGYKGVYEQFESVFALLGYCLIVYYAYLFIQTEEDVRFILKYLLYSVLAFSLLGLLQAINLDPIVSDIGKRIYLGREYWDYLDKFTLSFEPGRVYLTFYNPNYVGSYTALIIPILLGLLLTEKEGKKKICYILGLLGMGISLIRSGSETGMIALFVAILFFIFFFRKYIFKYKKIIFPIAGIGAVCIVVLIGVKFTTITEKVQSVFNLNQATPSITSIKTEEDLTITYKGNDLKLNLFVDSNGIILLPMDKDMNSLPFSTNENGKYTMEDERFAGIEMSIVTYNDIVCLDVSIEGTEWVFTNQLENDSTYYYLNAVGKFDKIVAADSAVFSGYESLATGRGYIWSRTIPLLKDRILLGSGAETYMMAFPQQDYVQKANYGFGGQLLTRPHNLYLQIGVQTGVVSLLAFLVFYIMYFISSIRIYKNGTFDSYLSIVGVSTFLGTIGYMITGLSNDSSITVAPVFWVLIGIGIAINYRLKLSKTNN